MGTTSNRSYPYPAGSDPVDVPGDLQALADDVDADMAAVIAGTGLADGSVTDAKLAVPKVDQSVVGNLLPVGFATSEDGTTVWRQAAGTLTITNDNTYARTGTRSQKIVTGGVGGLAQATAGTSLAQRYTVEPGRTYTFMAYARSDAADSWQARVLFYKADNTPSATSAIAGEYATVSTTDWTLLTVTFVAPSDAAVCAPGVLRSGGTAGPTLWVDDASLHQGAGGLWAPPGTPIANLGTYTDESVGRRIFTWDAVNSRWQMTYGDTGWRRINADIDALSTVTGNVDVRRVNDQVSVRVSSFKDTNTTPFRVNLLSTNLDVGFRPGAAAYATIPYDSATFGTYRNFYVAPTGVVQFGGPTEAGGFNGQFGFSVDAAWPASLPGTALGSIPS